MIIVLFSKKETRIQEAKMTKRDCKYIYITVLRKRDWKRFFFTRKEGKRKQTKVTKETRKLF